jgi:hypothetical protein
VITEEIGIIFSRMPLMLTWIGGLVALTTVVLVAAAQRWDRETSRTIARLQASKALEGGASIALHGSDDLPAPVARYFAFALAPGQRLIRGARIEHRGEFAQKPGAWAPFISVQDFTVHPSGFVWSASIRMAPGVKVYVRDSYLDGAGAMLAAAAGLVPVAKQAGTPQMASGALARFLAESAWMPTALLPTEKLRWSPIDEDSARATLSDRGNVVSLDFHFAPGGQIAGVSGERFRAVGDSQVSTPFEGRFADYERIAGMMIPTTGEVAWLLPEGRYAYWRARIVHAEYNYFASSVLYSLKVCTRQSTLR